MFHSFAKLYAEKVSLMSGGRVVIDMIPADKDAKAKPSEVLEAVHSGKIDGGFAIPSYWQSKAPASGLWEAASAFGMDSTMMLTWHKHGGGAALLDEIYKGIGADVKSILCVPMPAQPLGWFKKPISNSKEFKGLRYRSEGLAGAMMKQLGAEIKSIPDADIAAALRDGSVDAAEFNNTTSDLQLGLHKAAKYCMLQSFHQASGLMEVLISNKVLSGLPSDLQSILQFAAEALSADAAARQIDLNAKSYQEMIQGGTQFVRTSKLILQAQLIAWDKVFSEMSLKDPMFAKVLDSQRAYARRIVRWRQDVEVDNRIAYNHYKSKANIV